MASANWKGFGSRRGLGDKVSATKSEVLYEFSTTQLVIAF